MSVQPRSRRYMSGKSFAGARLQALGLPSSPGFIGTYQWRGVAALGLFGVGPDEALAFAILMHAVWYVPTSVIGGGLLLRRAVPVMNRSSGAPNRPDNPADSQHAAAQERPQNS